MKKILWLSIVLMFLLMCKYAYSIKDNESKPVAIVVKVKGEVFVLRSNNKIKADIYMPLYVKDKVQTGSYSTMELIFDSGISFKIEENCDIGIKDIVMMLSGDKHLYKVDVEIEINKGGVLVDAKTIQSQYKLNSLKMFTPTATAAVRGTIFYTGVRDDGKTDVAVFDGEVESYAGKMERIDDFTTKAIIKQDQQSSISEQTTVPSVVNLSAEMKEYKNTVVKSFIAKVEFYRKRIETLKQKRQDWIKKNKSDFEKNVKDRKKNFKKKYLK